MIYKRLLLQIVLIAFSCYVWAQGPNGSEAYYQAADGYKGAALKTALCAIINPHVQRTYNNLWTDFESTDKKPNGKVWDMYSVKREFTFATDQAGNYKKEGDVYNREHSFPKSWFNDEYPMYTDLFHLYPTDGWVNGQRGNLPFGEVVSTDYEASYDDFSKWGSARSDLGYSGKVFEPNDEYKGDFARTYFYMVTCYESYTNSKNQSRQITSWNCPMLDGNTYPGLSDWALTMLMKWSKQDPVSEKELARNKAVYDIQDNRNPFIDYPGLEDYIWGDKKNVAFSYDHYGQEPPGDDLPGDANGDGSVTISDAVAIVNKILGNPSPNFDETAADVNGDGDITITDAVAVVNIILGNGSGSSAPTMDMKEPEPVAEPE